MWKYNNGNGLLFAILSFSFMAKLRKFKELLIFSILADNDVNLLLIKMKIEKEPKKVL